MVHYCQVPANHLFRTPGTSKKNRSNFAPVFLRTGDDKDSVCFFLPGCGESIDGFRCKLLSGAEDGIWKIRLVG